MSGWVNSIVDNAERELLKLIEEYIPAVYVDELTVSDLAKWRSATRRLIRKAHDYEKKAADESC